MPHVINVVVMRGRGACAGGAGFCAFSRGTRSGMTDPQVSRLILVR